MHFFKDVREEEEAINNSIMTDQDNLILIIMVKDENVASNIELPLISLGFQSLLFCLVMEVQNVFVLQLFMYEP